MTIPVLTEVSAVVDAGSQERLLAAFGELVAKPVPDGLVRTELLRGPGNTWRVQTLWRDREALEAMRAGSEPPAAPALFRSVGAEPTLTVFEVSATHQPS